MMCIYTCCISLGTGRFGEGWGIVIRVEAQMPRGAESGFCFNECKIPSLRNAFLCVFDICFLKRYLGRQLNCLA